LSVGGCNHLKKGTGGERRTLLRGGEGKFYVPKVGKVGGLVFSEWGGGINPAGIFREVNERMDFPLGGAKWGKKRFGEKKGMEVRQSSGRRKVISCWKVKKSEKIRKAYQGDFFWAPLNSSY